MFNLYNIFNVTSNGYYLTFVDILSLLSVLFGISVINSKNPIVSVLFLIGLFITISVNLILLGYNFIGLSYLLVYVGAVSILFLFILMLINVRISEFLNDTSNSIPLGIYTGFFFCLPIYIILNNIDNKNLKFNTYMNSLFNYNSIEKNFTITNINDDLLETTKIGDIERLNSKLVFDSFFSDSANQNKLTLNSQDNIVSNVLQDNSKELYYVSSNSWDNNLININDITSVGNILYTTYSIWLIIASIILLLAMIGAITITKKEKI